MGDGIEGLDSGAYPIGEYVVFDGELCHVGPAVSGEDIGDRLVLKSVPVTTQEILDSLAE